MTITETEQEEIMKTVLQYFTMDEVKSMDTLNLAFIKELEGCETILEFLAKLKTNYPDNHNILIAGILFGINLSEIGYKYTSLPKFGHAM